MFELAAEEVPIDLLTDSGAGAMSAEQWAAIQRGNEAYAGAPAFGLFRAAVTGLFPFAHVLPAHQGRAAERILFTAAGGPGPIVPGNTHFDTTRANIEFTGASAVDLPVAEGLQPAARRPFRGNMDVAALERLLSQRAAAVPAGDADRPRQLRRRPARQHGQRPGRPRGLRPVRQAAVPRLLPDRGERLVHQDTRTRLRRRPGRRHHPPDGGPSRRDDHVGQEGPAASIGGWLALNDDVLAGRCRNLQILTEGFPAYGGLAGRDLEAIAQGLREAVGHDYLRYRVRSVEYLGVALEKAGVPVPFGGHAVFTGAGAMLPHIDPLAYPGPRPVVR